MMRHSMPLDTLTTARKLVAAGFERRQAEAVADALRDASRDFATCADIEATRADLEATRADLEATRADLEATRADIERAIEPLATRASLYRALWLQTGGIVAAVAGLLAIVARLP